MKVSTSYANSVNRVNLTYEISLWIKVQLFWSKTLTAHKMVHLKTNLNGILADTKGVPQLNCFVSWSRDNLTVISRERHTHHVLGMANKPPGGSPCTKVSVGIPKRKKKQRWCSNLSPNWELFYVNPYEKTFLDWSTISISRYFKSQPKSAKFAFLSDRVQTGTCTNGASHTQIKQWTNKTMETSQRNEKANRLPYITTTSTI